MAAVDEIFSVQFRRVGGTVVVAVAGELDMYTAPTLRERLVDLVENQGCLFVVVDIGAVSFVDSSALAVLIGAHRRLRDRGGELRVSGPTNGVYKVFEITGLARELTITRP
jgi:anti-sigma B factor antagonist